MENNLTTYLRLKKTPIKLEIEDQDDDCSVNYFQWTSDATSLLLKLRFDEERHAKFEDRSFQRKELWDEIANEMNRIGAHQVSADVCDLKYRNMLHTYKKNRNKELHGTDPESISWCYYEIFKQALKNNEEKDINPPDESTYDNGQIDESTNSSNTKRKRSKPELMEIAVTPNTELRAPSARLSNKRLHSALTQASQQHQQQNSISINESTPKIKVIENDQLNQNRALETHLTGFELEECRVFGETVGVQLSLIKSPETRALAELKIQEILYLAKVSKLKE